MSESKERLVQGSLDEVLENEETEDLGDPLGEKPIGYTPTGLPIYPSGESDDDLRRRLDMEKYDKKVAAGRRQVSASSSGGTKPRRVARKFHPVNPIDGSSSMTEISMRDMIRVRSKR